MQNRCVVLLLTMVMITSVSLSQSSRLNLETGQREELRYFIGGYAALGLNMHSAPFGALPGVASCCPEYRDASGLGPVFGLSFTLPLANALRAELRAGYASIGGDLLVDEVIGNEPVLDDGPVPTASRRDVTVEHSLIAGLPMIAIEPTIGWRAFDVLWLQLGMRAGFLLSPTAEQSERLAMPEGYTFVGGSTIRNTYEGPVPEANAMQLHTVFGLGYELKTRGNLTITPEVRYFLPLTSISSVDWHVQTFQIGVSVRYGIYTPIDAVIMRDTVYERDTTTVLVAALSQERVTLQSSTSSETTRREGDVEYHSTTIEETYLRETPKPFNATVRLAAFARDNDGIVKPLDSIRIEELDVIESYPLFPQVFFQEGSAELSGSMQSLLPPDEAKRFKASELSRNQLEVYHNLLNIVGDGMRKNTQSTLSIVGCTNNFGIEQNNKELAKDRANAVKDYLVSAFDISPSRLNVSARLLPANPANPTTADGKQENQRVELLSSDVTALEPVEFRDRDLKVTPEEIILRPTVTNGEDVASWSMSASQRSSELLNTTGTGLPTDASFRTDKNASGPLLNAPVVGKVTIKNALGLASEGSTTIPVDYATLQSMKSRQVEGKLIERYSLIVFEYNSSQLTPANQRLMQKVKDRIQPDSRVTITGFADRQGQPDYNRELARRRCLEAQRVLGLSDSQVTIDPVGSDRLIFDNDLPEGRTYSRTVQIEIQTPVR